MKPFLTAEWRDLIVVNYEIDPELLEAYVPVGTEVDYWDGKALVSLVAFRFLKTRLKGVPIPFHTIFEEANLRFYVRRRDGGDVRRGVVFIKELVPKYAVALTANLIYGEHYSCVPMSHSIGTVGAERRVSFSWINKGSKSRMSALVSGPADLLRPNSEAEFILEHYWGYTSRSRSKTSEYQVAHPRWRCWNTPQIELDIDFASTYGKEWGAVLGGPWRSAVMAEGSAVAVYPGRRINA